MDTFTVRDLCERTGELIRDAEQGKLSIVTKHGHPVFVALPFDETLVREGVVMALAVKLFEHQQISLGKAAKLAGMTQMEFMEHLGRLQIPVVRYSPDELERELEAFS